jgi:hypothetical protein
MKHRFTINVHYVNH